MSDQKTTVDVGGQEVFIDIPEDAVVTGAVVVATYQRMDGDEVGAGTVWGISVMPLPQAIGMVRLAQIAIEEVS